MFEYRSTPLHYIFVEQKYFGKMDQRVFDEAVNETMELLDMSYSEALKDTISQFQQMVSTVQERS